MQSTAHFYPQRTFMYRFILTLLFLFGLVSVAAAQDTPAPTPQVSFLAYDCEFQAESNDVIIHLALTDADGAPIPQSGYQISVAETDGTTLEPDSYTLSVPSQRSPVKLILVVDVTGSVPVDQIKASLANSLLTMPDLDEVALISFSSSLGDFVPFRTDKGALVNEELDALRGIPSDPNLAQLYNAVSNALKYTDPQSEKRQVILVLTDSNPAPRESQTAAADITNAAMASKTQIFAIGFNTPNDAPDTAELQTITNGANGYTWIYDGSDKSEQTVAAEVTTRLTEFMTALTGQLDVAVEVGGLTVATGSDNVPLNVTVTVDGTPKTVGIVCPVQQVSSSIEFQNVVDNQVVDATADVVVSIQSAISSSETQVQYILNGSIAATHGVVGTSDTFTFDPASPNTKPGLNTLEVEFQDRQNNVLDSAAVNLYVQYPLDLSLTNGDINALSDTATFQAAFQPAAAPSTEPTDVHFVVRSAADPTTREYPLGVEIVPLTDGIATLETSTLYQDIAAYYRNTPAYLDSLEVIAYILGDQPDRFLARSAPLPIKIVQPVEVTPEATPEPVAQDVVAAEAAATDNSTLLIALGSALLLLIIDLVLFRLVKRARWNRLIENPDDNDLPDLPMSVTVSKGGMQQTYLLSKKTMQLGRGSGNDINLGEDNNISRQHGLIMWRNNAWHYANRKPNLKATVNGKRCTGYSVAKLADPTQIGLGDYVLLFHSNEYTGNPEDLIKTNL